VHDRFPRLAAEIVAGRPDVIVADSTPAALAAMRATTNTAIPIVMLNVSDVVGSGLVQSLALSWWLAFSPPARPATLARAVRHNPRAIGRTGACLHP